MYICINKKTKSGDSVLNTKTMKTLNNTNTINFMGQAVAPTGIKMIGGEIFRLSSPIGANTHVCGRVGHSPLGLGVAMACIMPTTPVNGSWSFSKAVEDWEKDCKDALSEHPTLTWALAGLESCKIARQAMLSANNNIYS